MNQTTKRRVLVVGAGTAGLCALKHSLQQNMDVICYEQTEHLGGTWVYSENVHSCHELDVSSSMYEGLRTNLPKEVMGYPDFPFPSDSEESFVSSHEVLAFLQSYAKHFNLHPHIKFRHQIIRIRPRQGEWEVYVRNLDSGSHDRVYFDFVFICNGHYTAPMYPDIAGRNIFKGNQMHSHLYRRANVFAGETILVVGAGPSGMDITNHIHKYAKNVFLSHHMQPPPVTAFMFNVTQKPDVQRFTESGAIFSDGTSENFNRVIYCTGYKYSFPFISQESSLRVWDNYVYPLYKHCININYPTMALIGLPFKVCPTQLFDLQVRFALKFYTGQKKFPSTDIMMEDMEHDMQERWESGLSKKQAHQMGKKQYDYYKTLSEIAEIENIKPVIGKIMQECGSKYIYELESYRNNRFRIIDNENFVKISQEKS